MTAIIADGDTNGTVGNIDSVLRLRKGAEVVLDHQVIGETGEDAPGAIAFAGVPANHAVVGIDRPDAGARKIRTDESFDHDPVRTF